MVEGLRKESVGLSAWILEGLGVGYFGSRYHSIVHCRRQSSRGDLIRKILRTLSANGRFTKSSHHRSASEFRRSQEGLRRNVLVPSHSGPYRCASEKWVRRMCAWFGIESKVLNIR